MESNEKIKAVTYQRFSSSRQVDNSSLDRQSDAIKDWLKLNPDVVIIDNYVDKAMSGWTGENLEKGSLGKLLHAIEEGIIPFGTLILVEHFSRLSRQNIEKSEDLLRKIWAGGITIVVVRGNQYFPPESVNDMSQRFRLIIEIEKAFTESEWRSKKISASYVTREKKAREGIVPSMRRPFWLDRAGQLNDQHVVIEDIFKWYMEGLGQQRIIVQLRAKYPEIEAVKSMNPSTVMKWLQHEVVRGRWRGNKVYDAAVNDQLFFDVQAIHASRLYKNVKPDRNWPLSGLMQCGVCGGGMSIQKTKNTLPLVRCSSKQRDRSCNRKTTFPYFIVHQYMFSTVLKRALRKYTQNTANRDNQTTLVKIDKELVNLRVKLANEKIHYQEVTSQGKNARLIMDMMQNTDEKIIELEAEQNSIKVCIAEQDNQSISKLAQELVLTPRNFNLEMHKLGFRIVVGEDDLSTLGFQEAIPKMSYGGYCRKTMSYKYELAGLDFTFPSSGITENMLMLEGIFDENGVRLKTSGDIYRALRRQSGLEKSDN